MRLSPLVLALLVGCTGDANPGTDDTNTAVQGTLLGIGLSPREPVLAVDDSLQFQVKAFYDDTSTLDITNDVTWVSTESRVATISATGVVTAAAAGQAEVIATDARGVATKTMLTVRGPDDAPTQVDLSPRAVELKVGTQVEVRAKATFGDGSTGNIAATCQWSVDDGAVASVERGVVRGTSEGRSTIRATCGGLDAAAPITVRPAETDLDLPDLRVDDLIIDVVDGELWVLAEVRNVGEGMSPLAFVALYLDPPGEPTTEDEYAEVGIIDALAPDESGIALMSVAGVSEGAHQFWLVVDADGQIPESDEANASGPHPFSVTAARANLVVDVFEATTDGSYTFWTVEVRNAGTATARDFWIDLWHDPADEPEVCDTGDDFKWVSVLAPGDTYVWEPDLDDGPEVSWLSVVYVDSCDDVAESNEADNIEYVWVEE